MSKNTLPPSSKFNKSGVSYDKRNLFIVDAKVYDLTEWIDKHPGGKQWFTRSGTRDISAAVHAYHKDPEVVKKILSRYEVDIEPEEIIHPHLNVPKFILPEDFDAKKDILTYDWSKPDGFFSTLKSKIYTPKMQKRIKKADRWFNIVAIFILLAHILMIFVGVPLEILPLWAFVVFFTISRTALAAVGHYHCHAKKDGIVDWGDSLFDMQYVGATIILFDGHVMLHHLYTNSHADVKRTVFTGMLELPRLLRVPVFTIQKFGQFFTGYFIRWAMIYRENMNSLGTLGKVERRKLFQLLFVRLLLLAEFIFCLAMGYWLLWVLQFITTTWYNLFLIVSSHDFEESETQANLEDGQDWGVFQVENSFDMSVIGNKYVDCFLTAGLGTHRTHHVLPNQKSGFANIISDKIVRETCEEFGVKWVPTKNFLIHRLPMLFRHYVFAPVKNQKNQGFFLENFSIKSFKTISRFIYLGFKGEGSI